MNDITRRAALAGVALAAATTRTTASPIVATGDAELYEIRRMVAAFLAAAEGEAGPDIDDQILADLSARCREIASRPRKHWNDVLMLAEITLIDNSARADELIASSDPAEQRLGHLLRAVLEIAYV